MPTCGCSGSLRPVLASAGLSLRCRCYGHDVVLELAGEGFPHYVPGHHYEGRSGSSHSCEGTSKARSHRKVNDWGRGGTTACCVQQSDLAHTESNDLFPAFGFCEATEHTGSQTQVQTIYASVT